MTNTLERRVLEHKRQYSPRSFTARYNIVKLLYFEEYNNPTDAIVREKMLKGWRRSKKLALIKTLNPEMRDLFAAEGDASLRSA